MCAAAVTPAQFSLSVFGAAEVKLGEQVRGSGVDFQLILHGAARYVPNLDLHRPEQLPGGKKAEGRGFQTVSFFPRIHVTFVQLRSEPGLTSELLLSGFSRLSVWIFLSRFLMRRS